MRGGGAGRSFVAPTCMSQGGENEITTVNVNWNAISTLHLAPHNPSPLTLTLHFTLLLEPNLGTAHQPHGQPILYTVVLLFSERKSLKATTTSGPGTP